MLFVRPLNIAEGNELLRLVRHEASEIAAHYHFDVQHVRLIIRLFNEGGIEAIKDKKRSGRPPEFTPEQQ